MDIPLLVGYLILLLWLTVALTSMMQSVKVLPRMPSIMVFLLGLAMALCGLSLLPIFYVVLLLLTLIVSGFMGGLAYGFTRLRRNAPEGLHFVLAIISIAFSVLDLLGFVMLIPGSDPFLDGAGLIGVFFGLFLRYAIFA